MGKAWAELKDGPIVQLFALFNTASGILYIMEVCLIYALHCCFNCWHCSELTRLLRSPVRSLVPVPFSGSVPCRCLQDGRPIAGRERRLS